MRHFAVLLALAVALSAAPAAAQARNDFPVASGWFYSQANGQNAGGQVGYAVQNLDGIPFWDAFQRFGGVQGVGYPVSDRFQWNGFTTQAFQKVVFQWRPESASVAFVNVFDELTAAGRDDWLLTTKQVPKPADWSSDQGKSWPDVVANHYRLLDQNPAIRAEYFRAGDPVSENGLPMSAFDFPNVYVVRAQRKVFQQWKIDVPWARAGQVVTANGGDVGKEADLYPAAATTPKPPPGATGPVSPAPAVPTATPGAAAATPTATPVAAAPTSTATPVAAQPSPTAAPAPAVGAPAPTTKAIYTPGETAVQNNCGLSLTSHRAEIGSLLNPRASLTANFTITNYTGAPLTVPLSAANFTAEAAGLATPGQSVSVASLQLANGQSGSFAVTFSYAAANLQQFSSVTNITVVAGQVGPMRNIRWDVKVR